MAGPKKLQSLAAAYPWCLRASQKREPPLNVRSALSNPSKCYAKRLPPLTVGDFCRFGFERQHVFVGATLAGFDARAAQAHREGDRGESQRFDARKPRTVEAEESS